MNLELAFVDSISASPTVRLNLHTGPWSVLADTRFDPPPLRYATSSTLLVDGEQISAAAFGNRTITLRLMLQNVSEEQAATHLQTLARELNRATNFLRYRPGTTEPVFFRTKRCAPDSVTFDAVSKEVTVNVPAEPFALGLKETLSLVTVNNNPAAGSNGMFLDVSSVKGDVETPLYLLVANSVVVSPSAGPPLSAIAVKRRGTPSSAPFLLQAEAMTAQTDTSVQANNVLFSGAGSNFMRTTFATLATMTTRLTISTWPGSAGVDVRGTYRVFLRYRASTSAGLAGQIRLTWGNNNGRTITNDAANIVGDNGGGAPYLKYADLGLVQFPPGFDPVADGMSGTAVGAAGMYFAVDASRTSGTAGLDIDHLLFVPADDRLLLVAWPGATSPPTDLILDSDQVQVYARDGSGNVVSLPGGELTGLPPMVSPGVTNRVYFLLDVGTDTSTAGSGSGDLIANTTALTPYYWPRYLSVRPAST